MLQEINEDYFKQILFKVFNFLLKVKLDEENTLSKEEISHIVSGFSVIKITTEQVRENY